MRTPIVVVIAGAASCSAVNPPPPCVAETRSLSISPATVKLCVGQTQRFTASLTVTDGCMTTSTDVTKSTLCSAAVSRVTISGDLIRADAPGIEDVACSQDGTSTTLKVIVESCADAATD